MRDLNPRLPACKAGALTTQLIARFLGSGDGDRERTPSWLVHLPRFVTEGLVDPNHSGEGTGAGAVTFPDGGTTWLGVTRLLLSGG